MGSKKAVWSCEFWIMCAAICFWATWARIDIHKINQRIYPDGNTQPLATECWVKEQIEPRYDGYIYGKDKKVIRVKIFAESTDSSHLIVYNNHDPNEILLIKQKDFHRYLTLEELQEKTEAKCFSSKPSQK